MVSPVLKKSKPRKTVATDSRQSQLLVFKTALGWVAISHVGHLIRKVKFGYKTRRSVLEQFDSMDFVKDANPSAHKSLNLFERELVECFSKYASGEDVSFEDLEIDEGNLTPFQQSVRQACRSIPFGETASYGELAEMAGSPRAARAVGSVMANNDCPLIVPCHRVVASGRKIGGFSAPNGTSLKMRLLKMERALGFRDEE